MRDATGSVHLQWCWRGTPALSLPAADADPASDRDGRTQAVVHGVPDTWLGRTTGHLVLAAESASTSNSLVLSITSGRILGSADDQPAPTTPPSAFGGLDLIVKPASTLRIEVTRSGLPVPGVGLTADFRFELHPDPNEPTTTTRGRLCVDATTGQDGVASIDPAPAGHLLLAIDDHHDVPTAILPRSSPTNDAVRIDLDRWPVVTWQVAERGAAGLRPRLLLWPAEGGAPHAPPLVVVTDRSDRCRVRMEPGNWLAAATDGRGFTVQIASIAEAPPDAPLRLALQPLARFAGRVVDARGDPVAGVTVRTPFGTDFGLPEGVSTLDRLLREHHLALDYGLTPQVRTDNDGRFELFFLPLAGIKRDAVAGQDSPRIPLTPRTDVEFRLRR